MKIKLKRIYEPKAKDDGERILVDRLWPRGMSKERADLDLWLKEIAPSTQLRKWFDHDPKKWDGFKKKYRAELEKNIEVVDKLRRISKKSHTTLLYAAKDEQHNEAIIIKDFL